MSTDGENWPATSMTISEQAPCLQSFTSDQNEDAGLVVSHSIAAEEDSAEMIGALMGWLNPSLPLVTIQEKRCPPDCDLVADLSGGEINFFSQLTKKPPLPFH